MPLLLLILALVGVILYLKGGQSTLDPNSPEGKLQAVVDSQEANVITAIDRQTQDVQLTSLQQVQIQKFSAIATIAGTATTVAVAGLSTLTLAAAGPIGATVAGLIIAFAALRGTAHLVANQWTSGVQRQFNDALTAISGEVQRAQADGSVSKLMLTHAMTAISRLWAQYYAAGERFASEDADHRLVIDQSYCDYINYRCPKGKQPLLEIGLVNRLLADMQAARSKLKV